MKTRKASRQPTRQPTRQPYGAGCISALVAILFPHAAWAQSVGYDPAGSSPVVGAVHWVQGTLMGAVNTGHPGSITTIHADSPEGAIEQLALIVLQAGTQLRREDIVHYVRQVVDCIVQLERRDGRRQVARIMLTRP